MRGALGMAMVTAGLGLGTWTCAQGVPKPPPQDTRIEGSVYNRAFTDTSAAFTRKDNPPTVVMRVIDRDDACDAVADPSDDLDPSLLLTVVPGETGTFPVISTQMGSAAPARYATATLFTYQDLPDGGFGDAGDAGRTRVARHAVGGEVEITELDPAEDGRLNAEVVLLFENGEGYTGKVGARPCDNVR